MRRKQCVSEEIGGEKRENDFLRVFTFSTKGNLRSFDKNSTGERERASSMVKFSVK